MFLICACEHNYKPKEDMRYRKIPDETIGRLPLYLRKLQMFCEQNRRYVNSSEFADNLGVNPAVVRRDLSLFGAFGTPGVGYNAKKLLDQLRNILKLKGSQKTALVGVGNLGLALLSYSGFASFGFEIVAVFDSDPKKIGKMKKNIMVEDISGIKTLKKRGIRLAIIAVPASDAQEIADNLIEAGVVGILNFAPSYLTVPNRVRVIRIDIAMDLARLPYYLPATRE